MTEIPASQAARLALAPDDQYGGPRYCADCVDCWRTSEHVLVLSDAESWCIRHSFLTGHNEFMHTEIRYSRIATAVGSR